MIKQQNKKYSIVILVCLLVQVLAIIGSYTANYYTKTRMGMQRHMVYLNDKWENTIPIDLIKYLLIGIIIILLIGMYFRYRKRTVFNKLEVITAIITLVINIGMICFLFFYGLELNKAYYILAILFVLIMICQNIIFHCVLLSDKKI